MYILPSLITQGLWKGLHFHELLIYWGKTFGGFYYFDLGYVRMVIINDFEILREAWKHPDLNDRAPSNIRDAVCRGKGR